MYSNQVRESHQSLPGNGMKKDEDGREVTLQDGALGTDGYIHSLNYCDGFTGMIMSKLIKL